MHRSWPYTLRHKRVLSGGKSTCTVRTPLLTPPSFKGECDGPASAVHGIFTVRS
jgi:hypothetical protein